MKKLIALSLLCVASIAAQMTVGPKLKYNGVAWINPPGTSSNLIYIGLQSGVYSQAIQVGTNTFAFDFRTIPLSPNVYYVAVTCLDATGNESGPGPEVVYRNVIPPATASTQLTTFHP